MEDQANTDPASTEAPAGEAPSTGTAPPQPAPVGASAPPPAAPAASPPSPVPAVDLEHPEVKAAIAAAASEAASRATEAALTAERERVAEEQRKAALTEEQRRAQEATANKAAAEKAPADAARATLERDVIASLAASGRVIPPGDRRMGVASSIVSELMAADASLTVSTAVAKALAEQPWLGDVIGGGGPRPSTVAPQPPAPQHVPPPPRPKDASEMSKAEWNEHLAKNGIRVH